MEPEAKETSIEKLTEGKTAFTVWKDTDDEWIAHIHHNGQHCLGAGASASDAVAEAQSAMLEADAQGKP